MFTKVDEFIKQRRGICMRTWNEDYEQQTHTYIWKKLRDKFV